MTTPSTIAIAPDITQYFQEVISDAIRVRKVEATDAAATYLVSLLCSFTHPDDEAGSGFNRPITFLLHAALEAYPDADLIVLLSSQVYDDVTQFGDPYLAPDRFQRAEVASPARGYRDTGWIYVPRLAV